MEGPPVHMDVVAADIQREQELEDKGMLGIEDGQGQQQAGCATSIYFF